MVTHWDSSAHPIAATPDWLVIACEPYRGHDLDLAVTLAEPDHLDLVEIGEVADGCPEPIPDPADHHR